MAGGNNLIVGDVGGGGSFGPDSDFKAGGGSDGLEGGGICSFGLSTKDPSDLCSTGAPATFPPLFRESRSCCMVLMDEWMTGASPEEGGGADLGA